MVQSVLQGLDSQNQRRRYSSKTQDVTALPSKTVAAAAAAAAESRRPAFLPPRRLSLSGGLALPSRASAVTQPFRPETSSSR